MKYEKPKLRFEEWEEEEDVVTESLSTDEKDDNDPWTGGNGEDDNVNDSLWL